MSDDAIRSMRGFSVVEMLVVVAVIGILANIAVPIVLYQLRKAHAMAVISDFLLFRTALLEYGRDHSTLPPDTYPGREPPQLESYLEGKVSFRNPNLGYSLDWENWKRPDGRPKHRRTAVYYGLSLTTRNDWLVEMIRKEYDGQFWYTLGRNYTFVIETIPNQPPPRWRDPG